MRTLPSSDRARHALVVVEALQSSLVTRLERAAATQGLEVTFEPVEWDRDAGRHGGGVRFGTGDNAAYDRASVNVSAIHYDDMPERSLAGATAISAIVHPRNPHAPSMHMHISHTEVRAKGDQPARAVWRVMADLNPSMPYDADRDAFTATLRQATGETYEEGAAQGDRYFHIPALDRHRGVTHFYLESWTSGDPDHDEVFARSVGEAVIDRYGAIIEGRMGTEASDADRVAQRAYHTLYLFQVLTLDRGTTSGLLIHSQNDVGIMGSLPSVVDPALLAMWADRVPPIQKPLVLSLVDVLRKSDGQVTIEAKKALADGVRAHYRAHPEALELQARGNVVPPTVANHR